RSAMSRQSEASHRQRARKARRERPAVLALFCSLFAVPCSLASSPAGQPTAPAPEEVVDAYLADHQPFDPLAARLRQRVTQGPPPERAHAAELLAKLYVRMLAAANTPGPRQSLEERARDLLKVPEADSFELRIDLAKATYLKVEE